MHKTIYVKTTETCNLNCSHCFTGGNSPERSFLNLNQFGYWVKRLNEYANRNDTFHFELHGGEPFLMPVDQLKKLTQLIRSWGPWKSTIGATTNLVYKLSDELLYFMQSDLSSVGTSWDPKIRFSSPKQEALWKKNLKTLLTVHDVTLNISLSKAVVAMDQEDLLKFIRDTGCYRVLFDRITDNGSAKNHQWLFPTNLEIQDWYMRIHEATEKLNARSWFENGALEDVYAKFEKNDIGSGTFCRNCEETIFTINADGTIGGCPNGAPEERFGHLSLSLEDLHNNPQRTCNIADERTSSSLCFTCPVYSVCGSDCHRLAWDGPVCAAPRSLMMRLSGHDQVSSIGSRTKSRVIPIHAG